MHAVTTVLIWVVKFTASIETVSASYINGKEIICIPIFSGYDSFLLMLVLMTVRYSLGYYIKLGWIFAVFGKKKIFKAWHRSRNWSLGAG